MSAVVIPFPERRGGALEIAPHGPNWWLVTHIREFGQRMVVAQRPTLEEARASASRMSSELGHPRVIVLTKGRCA